jgi:hypothetical protein
MWLSRYEYLCIYYICDKKILVYIVATHEHLASLYTRAISYVRVRTSGRFLLLSGGPVPVKI